MAESKIFAGPRVRRVRNRLGITQTTMAEGLGISPSYLNLIERNQLCYVAFTRAAKRLFLYQ